MSDMDVDSPSEFSSPSPRDRIIRRLAQQGFPMEGLDQLQLGLVVYVKNNKFRMPELVSAILQVDEDVMEAIQAKSDSENDPVYPGLRAILHESMVWLQWLMFEGEPRVALKGLSDISVGQRGVCGAVWGNNDLAYRCRTCGHDPTCAICVPCFQNGNHKGHDYSIIYTGGGCCDCGDVTAWKREGFCSKHRGVEQIQPLSEEYTKSMGPVLDALLICWRNKLLFAETLSEELGVNNCYEHREVADELAFVIIEMLLEFCHYSESLLSFVARKVFSTVGLLDLLVKAEEYLGKDAVNKLHELLLKLLGEPAFKYEFAKAFISYYPIFVNKVCKDISLKDNLLLSTFSVQIFTVQTLTPCLVEEMNLLEMLLGCLEDIFISCAGEDGRLQASKSGNLYETIVRVVGDIQFVLSHDEVIKYVILDHRHILRSWMRLLAFVQGMNPQKRETGIHVEEENENTSFPFGLCLSFATIHSLLVAGAFSVSTTEEDSSTPLTINERDLDDKDSIRHAKVGRLSQESSVCSTAGSSILGCTVKTAESKSETVSHLPIPSTVIWLIFECLRALENWLGGDKNLLTMVSPNINNTCSSNFLALKKTLSKIRKGKYIFKLTGSSKSQSMKCSSPHSGSNMSCDMENGQCTAQDSKSINTNMDNASNPYGDPAGFDGSATEGEYGIDLDALHVLSLSYWPDITYDVSSQDISVHIPLHRLLSLFLQKALRNCYGESALPDVSSASCANPVSAMHCDFFGHALVGCHPNGFSAFVMEHPLRNRVFCAEVHAGMWRKNGDSVLLSCGSYRSVRWGGQDLELDLFLLQCCAALAPADFYATRILERFGLSCYLSLNPEFSSEYEPVLVQEMLILLIQIVKERGFCGLTTAESLKRELVYRLSIGDATHSQLMKFLPRDLSKSDQLTEILSTVALYSNPSGMKQGMYSLQWNFWKELDLYHPRWNSRDLQVAEERYLRFCSVSPLTTQLPKWTKIYPPLKGVARVATCRTVFQIIRSVIYYAVISVIADKFTISRAPDTVLLTALHLLALALDICALQKNVNGTSCFVEDAIPMLAFAVEEIGEGVNNISSDQCLLSLLVSLMRLRKDEDVGYHMEAGSCNISSLIESLLKKFAEVDSRCMTKLQKLAPEVVNHLVQSFPNSDTNILGSASDGEKRKAKARERQAAILEKMKAEQSKFLESIKSSSDDGLNCPVPDQKVCESDDGNDSEESVQDVCSLCRDPNSRSSVSYLILLEKSKLLSFVDRGPPSWEQVHQPNRMRSTSSTNKIVDQSESSTFFGSSGMILSSELVQKALNELASGGQPGDVNAFLEFIRTRYPALRNIQKPCGSSKKREGIAYSFEIVEEDMYFSIQSEMQDNLNIAEDEKKFSIAELCTRNSRNTESILLGKYMAAISREMMENCLGSQTSHKKDNSSPSEISAPFPSYDGFGPCSSDGVFISSCGHAVHQGCLDRYLSSLKERYSRRISFEGGHIVDPDKGEFLCPVCRRFANSVLPGLPGGSQKIWKKPKILSSTSKQFSGGLDLFSQGNVLLKLRKALSLLQSAANVIGKDEIYKTFPMRRSGRVNPNLEPFFRVLCGMYFTGKEDKLSQSARVSQTMIMWDTLKYSLISMEVAARSSKIQLTPTYDLNALYKGLESSNGFILSLLLKTVQRMRSKNIIHVLQRFIGIQMFAESICSVTYMDEPPSGVCRHGDNMLRILNYDEMEIPYPDIQFWKRASDPVLSHDPFSSLMWVLFCLPYPFLSCEESVSCLVHLFYAVSVAQAIITYCCKYPSKISELGFQDCLITDICKVLGEGGIAQQYFVSSYISPSDNIKDIIRSLSFPYLRRCALLCKLVSLSTSAPFCDAATVSEGFSSAIDAMMDNANGIMVELTEVEKLESMFKIPALDVVLKDEVLRSSVMQWFRHFRKEFEVHGPECVLYSTPAVPFKLMQLPHVYQDILERYIKQRCPDCEPALCLLCGRLCSASLKPCCRESGCQTHAMACGSGTGVFLLIRKTTVLLQRSGRRAPWPSPYLDAFGEEDIEMLRGKPLYLNEERYAALTHMVASHGLDQSSKVLGQTTIGAFFMI
ncbi:E3 ubiquitin-protein ligase PRT6 [Malania oleifera]|uniref:E3 ubiquitin-protein ligase PRT6 n=1 Tax=Malania oleifera TaxID=397392 RepID=UPI0025AE7141|nr:E3 ubiquitin-protein ligase PRT6 [Malania oleifera]